jgi:AraC-like DNA-binding protein
MPIYMDVHIVPGVKAKDVAEAHLKDILLQEEHACKCMTYWVDEERENVFCLIEAPDKDAVAEMHGRAHGLIPNKIIEVNSNVVESFLGRIYDPSDAITNDDGLKIFADKSFRVIMVTTISDRVLLEHKLGKDKAQETFVQLNETIKKLVAVNGGREAEHGGDGFIVSFASASKAVSCATAIQKEISTMDVEGFRIALNAGEPVSSSEKIFGDTIQLAQHLCTIAKPNQVAISSAVKELIAKDPVHRDINTIFYLLPQDESLLELFYKTLELHWQNSEFTVDDFARSMAMSTSQLYRKTIDMFGLSPNILLKDFRLHKAKELMKKRRYTIAQITFDTGFTSPSYFTKCFKSKYGLLPMAYLEAVS